jgi:hypothetical protein
LLVTHTGIPWSRRLPERLGGGLVVNVGAIGRPANDGHPAVWYALLEIPGAARSTAEVTVSWIPVGYDVSALAQAMKEESLPEEFIETIVSGYWTTCLEILPAKERQRGRF